MNFCLKILLAVSLLLMAAMSPCVARDLQTTPQEIQQRCAKDMGRCVKQQKTTGETYAKALDSCWPRATQCPEVCVEEYAVRRKAGMSALDADPLYKGRWYELGSCIPGMNEIKHPGRKLLPLDSEFDLSLSAPGGVTKIAAIVSVSPLNKSGAVAVSENNPRRQAHYEAAPLHLALPAGNYRILVVPPKDSTALREQTLIVKLKKGESLRQTMALVSSTSSVTQGEGTLRLLGANPADPVYYTFVSAIDSSGKSNQQARPSNGRARSDRDFSLSSGTYLLKLQPQNYAGGEQQEVVSIYPGKITTLKVVFQQAGQLRINVKGLLAGQKVGLNIWKLGERQRVLFIEPQVPPLSAKLAPGTYDVSLYIPSSAQLYGVERQLQLDPLVIAPGATLQRQINVPAQPWGTLRFSTLLEGQAVAAHVMVRSVKRPNYEVYPVANKNSAVKMPLEIKLVAGDYRLSLWGDEPRGKREAIYPKPQFERKNVALHIKAGETLTKKLEFTRQVPSELTLRVLLNGSAVKARIRGRIAGSNSPFSAIGTNYNLLTNKALILPGIYDFSIQPLAFTPSLGIDVFHGRVGPWLVTRKAKGTKPLILHNIEIKPDSHTSKTLRFESTE